MAGKQSLSSSHPGFGVPAALAGCLALLTLGLNLPVLHVEKMLFWKDDYSIIAGVRGMVEEKQYGLAALIFFFSVVFPYGKLGALLVLWFGRFGEQRRQRILTGLKLLGKWSMLDVFVVAVIVVITKSGGLLNAEPRVGIYVFAAAVAMSMGVSIYVDWVAGRP